MENYPLNQIIVTESGWCCCVFEFDRINFGNVYMSSKDYSDINVHPIQDCHYRYYKKSKKIIISGSGDVNSCFCALDFNFEYWKCLICKKITRKNDHNCFCNSYSICWTPIKPEIVGLLFLNDLSFEYNSEDSLNIIWLDIYQK